MNQQDALCRAVCRHPDEDVPRLIFADHLEEYGDARRAAFIRRQVELARVPEHDPFHAARRRKDPDASRGWSMAHTLPPLPAGASWRRFQFRRGFPWLASVTSLRDLLNNGDLLFAAAPIQALELNAECGVNAHWNRFTEWPHLANLTRLEFTHTRLSTDAVRRLCRSPFSHRLRELSFECDAITSDGLHALAESVLFPRLRRLELRHAALAPALAMDALAAAPPGLSELALAECKFPGTDVAWLLNHPIAEKLVSLDVSGNPLRAAGVAAVVERCRELKVLRLRETALGLEGIRALATISAGLRILDLSGNRLGPASAKLLAESPHLRESVELDLRGNELGEESIRLLKGRFGWVQIETPGGSCLS